MRSSDLLKTVANWLEDADENEIFSLAEDNDDCLKIVAQRCCEAAFILKKCAEEIKEIEPVETTAITPESIEQLAEIATAFDQSNDPLLKKQASLIDELLLTISASPHEFLKRKASLEDRIEELKKKYKTPAETLKGMNKVSESEKAIEKSKANKDYSIMGHPLSTRYCPDHPGVSLQRINEDVMMCSLDNKKYDFRNGYTLNDGSKVSGSSVENQTDMMNDNYNNSFDSRESRLNKV